jgi:RNA polymerase sigma-70 factor (ECF subfamily)
MGAQQVGPPLAGETAFDAFYRDHRDRLIATVNAATRCGADAATDAVDEAFVRALARWPRVERMDAPAGWIFTVARNVVHKTRGRRSVESDLAPRARGIGLAGEHGAPDVAPEAQWELWDAVGALPERERTAVALRYLGDLTEPQVAQVMGVAVGTVSATLHSARKRLATQLGDPVDDRAPGASARTETTDHGGQRR